MKNAIAQRCEHTGILESEKIAAYTVEVDGLLTSGLEAHPMPRLEMTAEVLVLAGLHLSREQLARGLRCLADLVEGDPCFYVTADHDHGVCER